MSYRIFDEGDAPYFQWLHEHPEGFVLNTRRAKGDRSAMVHRPHCKHISALKGLPNGFTMNADIKVVSEQIEDLFQYIVEHKSTLPISLNECGTCHAMSEPLLIERQPDEVSSDKAPMEGAKRVVVVNVYERSATARAQCIAFHGTLCKVCGIDFGSLYGTIGEGFIHVHHLEGLAQRAERYQVDPVNDLVPVCPNCHSMLHRGVDRPRTIDELKKLMKAVEPGF